MKVVVVVDDVSGGGDGAGVGSAVDGGCGCGVGGGGDVMTTKTTAVACSFVPVC